MSGVILAEGVVEVTADAKHVPQDIGKQIEDGANVTAGAGQKIGTQIFGGIVTAWAAIGAAEKIGGFFTGAIGGASDLNETLSKSSTIFGTQASAIESFGNMAYKNVGLSKEAAIGAAAAFGDMFTQIGFTQDAAAAMSQQVIIAAADLGSFSNLETADVADRISAAFRGEYDSLQAVIPNINAARVESEALAATGKTLASELTATEKASAVLAIVQKDGANAMGDFARTADGAANSQKTLTASVENQQAKLGGLLLPAWSGFLGILNDGVIPAMSDVIDWMGQNGDVMLMLAGVIGGATVAYWGITSAMAIHKAFMIASAAATGGLTFAQWALNAAMSANPIGLIITGIAALVAGIIWVATQTTFFQDTWTNVTNVVGTAWNWLWTSVLSPVFDAIGTGVGWLVTNVFEPVGGFIMGVVQGIGDVFNWLYNNIIMPVVTGIMLYIGIWAAVVVWLWESVISPVVGAIGTAIGWLGDNVFAPLGMVVDAVFQGIGAAFNWIWNSIISPVIQYIQLGIQAWGAIFTWLHDAIIAPVFAAVGAAFSWVWNSVISPVVGFISGAITNVGNTVRAVFGGIGDFIGAAFQAALNVIRGPINGIISLVNSAISGLNKLSVTIPDWVPVVGGQTWGLSIPKIPMLAEGGVVRSGGRVLVGERGPEFLDLPRGAQVTPLGRPDALPNSGGGGGGIRIDKLEINEAEDPLGSAGRLSAELRKWRKR